VFAAAAAAVLGMTVPAAAQGVTIGVDSGMHRDRGHVVVRERTHLRPRADRVVIVKKKRPHHYRSYGYERPRSRTVIIHR
jgi:hypothetical protein